jgi:DNA-binding MarR family transcriptional regulator
MAMQPKSPGGISLVHVLGHLERQVSRRVEEVLAAEQLTVDQWRVLDLLADGQWHPMSWIAAHIAVPGATLTKLVDRLVDTSLVYRLVDETDRRRVLVYLWERGREVHERLRPAIENVEADILHPLPYAGQELVELLNQLAAPTMPNPLTPRR